MLVNMLINIRLITDPALILYVSFENAACQVVGTIGNISLLGEWSVLQRNVFTMEEPEKGNGDPRFRVGDREQEEVMKLKDFIMNGGCQYE